ncbi:MAG: hypothetical protein PF495_08115, partial [Spirochaetales bacterium]|nr:hypothetical protein [Spirochaetales bacterium]
TYVQGMRGRVSHDGEFISEQKKNIIHKLERFLIDAATFTEKKQWQEALSSYNEALTFIQNNQALIGSEQEIILEKIAALEVKQEEQTEQLASEQCLAIMNLANKAYDRKNWAQAIEKYNEAITHANRFNVRDACVDTQSTAKHNSTVLTILLEKADTLRSADKPSEAVDSYRQAIDHATASNMAQATIANIQRRIDALKEQVLMARVRLFMNEGDTLIKQGDFRAGLSKYNFGLTLLESNSELLQGKAQLSATLSQKINRAEKIASITAHTVDLTTFAQAGLKKHFALSPQAQLSKPTIIFIEKQNNLSTYRISATDLRDKINYEMLYQFDENTGTWNIIENKMD